MAIELEKIKLNEASVAYSKLTDAEAKERVQQVKNSIKEILHSAEISKDPRKMFELRELQSSLAWFKLNKNMSKYFDIVSSGPSMRAAKRHPHVGNIGSRKPNRQK